MLRGLCTVLIAAATAAAAASASGPAVAADGGDQSISVTVPQLVFGSPKWLPLRLYVVEYPDGTELAAQGFPSCSVLVDIVDDGCLLERPDGTVWFVVLAS